MPPVKYGGSDLLASGVAALLTVGFMIYALKSFRAVFGGAWPVTIAKAIGIGLVYAVVSMPAFAVMMVWASWT